MIIVNNLSKKYGTRQVLENVTLKITKGKVLVLYGRNGAGKTTLIKCVCGLLNFTKGEVDLGTSNILDIGIVLESEMLIPKLTVYEYLEFVCTLKKLDSFYKKIEFFIIYFDLSVERNNLISKLSKGTKSKLKLISAIISEPNILLLDEPFTGMDIIAIDKSLALIKENALKGCSILLSTHHLDIIQDIQCDLAILKEKTIKKIISYNELKEHKNNLKAHLLKNI